MRKAVLFIVILFSLNGFSFNGPLTIDNFPKIGDILVINEPPNQNYNHVYFPKLNFIVKRGGLSNYKSVYGEQVVVKKVTTKNDGTVHVQLESKSGKKFFGFLKNVKADYEEAIKSGEMSILYK